MEDTEEVDLTQKPNRGPRVDKTQLMSAAARIPEVLKSLGFDSMREGQDVPIYNIMAGRDTLCILPTGAGKTAIFVIPTLCLDWRTIVFSPLVALMRDQVRGLWEKGIPAGQVSGLQTPAENSAVLGEWLEGRLKFLYVAPERLGNEMFITAMKHVTPDMVVLDECFTGDVELLTESGFIRFDELESCGVDKVAQVDAGSGDVTFTEYDYIEKYYTGQMVGLYSDKKLDLDMTANHEWLAYRKDGSYKKQAVLDFNFNHLWDARTAAGFKGNRMENTLPYEDRLRLAFQADGSFHGNKSALFSFTKQRKVDRFLDICQALDIEPREVNSLKQEKKRFTINLKGIAVGKNLCELFDLSSMSQDYARSFVDEVSRWDGSVIEEGSMLYYSSALIENTSFVQAVCVLAGFKTNQTIQKDDRKPTHQDMHRLFIDLKKAHVSCQNVDKRVYDYEGNVYCVRVPKGNIVVRRRGKVVVTGNCHTLSQWSDNFRPDYIKVGGFIQQFDPKVVSTFTATAPAEVESDVRRVLGIPHANRCKFYPRRENLELKSEDLMGDAQLANLLYSREGSAIVYCSTIRNVEDVATFLSENLDEEVTYYHGQLSSDQKRVNQDRFMNNKARIVVATNAFGMGIDKPDIRMVIHRDLPGSLEALSQEVGRAGRDGKPSLCMSYRHQKAISTQNFFIESANPHKSDIQAVYDTLKMSEDSNGEIRLKMNEIAEHSGVNSLFIQAALSVLAGAGCLKRTSNTNKTFQVKLEEPDEDDVRMVNYFNLLKEGGVEAEDGLLEVSMDWLLEKTGLTQGTVMKYIKQWAKDGWLFYEPPYNGKITHITGPLDLVDFDRLETKAKRDWDNFEKLLAYFDTPDEDKHEFLEKYFGKD